MMRPKSSLHLEQWLDPAHIVICPPIMQELLQGIREESAHRKMQEVLRAFTIVESPMPVGVFEEASDLFRAARRLGITVRSSVDCQIAACALRHNLTVVHRDRDFTNLARVSALKVRPV